MLGLCLTATSARPHAFLPWSNVLHLEERRPDGIAVNDQYLALRNADNFGPCLLPSSQTLKHPKCAHFCSRLAGITPVPASRPECFRRLKTTTHGRHCCLWRLPMCNTAHLSDTHVDHVRSWRSGPPGPAELTLSKPQSRTSDEGSSRHSWRAC